MIRSVDSEPVSAEVLHNSDLVLVGKKNGRLTEIDFWAVHFKSESSTSLGTGEIKMIGISNNDQQLVIGGTARDI